MALPSSDFQRIKAFFHAVGKANTEGSQYTYESLYKSSHNILAKEVWTDTIDYCVDEAAADAFALANPTVILKHVDVPLTELPGSNGQAWYIDIAGEFIRPFVAETDVPEPTTNAPSYGFQPRLKTGGGVLIPPATGVWLFEPYSGLVFFQGGNTPADMGWGIPQLTAYQYIGNTLDSAAGGDVVGYTQVFTNANLTGGKIIITHNLSAKDLITQVTVKDNMGKHILIDDVEDLDKDRVELDLQMITPLTGQWTVFVSCLNDGTPPVVIPIVNRFINGSAINTITFN